MMSLISTFISLQEPLAGEIEASEAMVNKLPSLDFSFTSALLFLSLLILLSIVFDKFGIKLGIPGSIFIFFLGLFSHLSGLSYDKFPLEELHVVSLCILLFFSGLSVDRSIIKRNKLLVNSINLAVFGTLLSMAFWLIYLRTGFGIFYQYFGYLKDVKPELISLFAVTVVFSIAVQDWNSFAFVPKRIKNFRTVLTNIFKIETAISASISVAIAELLVLLWLGRNPEYLEVQDWNMISSILQGILVGSLTGIILGYLLTLMIRHVVTSKPQLVLASVSMTFIGYVVSYSVTSHGGYLCALVMGIVTSISCRQTSTEDEIEFLAEELESLNIATEAILFFAVGLALQASSFFANLPVAIFIWLGITFIRQITVYLFFRGSELQPEERMLLSFWSPKGAISMAFIVTSPALLEETFGINLIELIPEGAYLFTSDVVCGAVLISMIVNSLMIPKLHSLFISFFPKSPQS
jgi:potassium/hydrogen antiporter